MVILPFSFCYSLVYQNAELPSKIQRVENWIWLGGNDEDYAEAVRQGPPAALQHIPGFGIALPLLFFSNCVFVLTNFVVALSPPFLF